MTEFGKKENNWEQIIIISETAQQILVKKINLKVGDKEFINSVTVI